MSTAWTNAHLEPREISRLLRSLARGDQNAHDLLYRMAAQMPRIFETVAGFMEVSLNKKTIEFDQEILESRSFQKFKKTIREILLEEKSKDSCFILERLVSLINKAVRENEVRGQGEAYLELSQMARLAPENFEASLLKLNESPDLEIKQVMDIYTKSSFAEGISRLLWAVRRQK